MAISAKDVKDLREKTGAGMMDCKKALNESNGDFEAAVDWLRTKGLAAAAKKSGRVAAEGLVAVATNKNIGTIIEVNSETDFVSKNEQFQKFVIGVSQVALQQTANDIDVVKQAAYPNVNHNVEEELTRQIATIGENMSLRRVSSFTVGQGVVTSYIHNAVAPNMGKIGVLVALESAASEADLQELGKKLAMHIAATNPQSLNIDSLDEAVVQRERDIFSEQAKNSGKPDNIIEKMVEGRIRKFYEEAVLLEQTFIMDNETQIKNVIAGAAKELGQDIKLVDFVRYGLGDGIEKEESDFAAEVKQQLAG